MEDVVSMWYLVSLFPLSIAFASGFLTRQETLRGDLIGYIVYCEFALLVANVLSLRCSEISGSGYQE